MQKLLWIITALIICVGIGFIWHNQNPDPCSERGIQKYLQDNLGAIPSLRVSSADLQKIRAAYLKKNKCNVKAPNSRKAR